MIVVIAGMWRSGSTFAFNVARDFLKTRGGLFQATSMNVTTAVQRSEGADYILLKSHGFDPAELAQQQEMRVVCTTRRIEDAFASWIETFQWEEEHTLALLRDWLQFYDVIRDKALTIPYRQVDHVPWYAAYRLGRYIAPDVTPWEAYAVARRYAKAKVKRRTDRMRADDPNTVDLGFTYFDQETLFHRRHVSSLRSRPAEQRLAASTLDRVRAVLGSRATDLGIS